MSAKIYSFLQKQKPTHWTQAELAEFYRTAELLRRSGLDVVIEAGITDEDEPWIVFIRDDTQDVIAHFARIEGEFVAASVAMDGVVRGSQLRPVLDRILYTQPLILPPVSEQGHFLTHPAAVLAAFIATAYVCTVNGELFAATYPNAKLPEDNLGEGEPRRPDSGNVLRAALSAPFDSGGRPLDSSGIRLPAGSGDMPAFSTCQASALARVSLALVLTYLADTTEAPPPEAEPSVPPLEAAPTGQDAGAAHQSEGPVGVQDSPEGALGTTDGDTAIAGTAVENGEESWAAKDWAVMIEHGQGRDQMAGAAYAGLSLAMERSPVPRNGAHDTGDGMDTPPLFLHAAHLFPAFFETIAATRDREATDGGAATAMPEGSAAGFAPAYATAAVPASQALTSDIAGSSRSEPAAVALNGPATAAPVMAAIVTLAAIGEEGAVRIQNAALSPNAISSEAIQILGLVTPASAATEEEEDGDGIQAVNGADAAEETILSDTRNYTDGGPGAGTVLSDSTGNAGTASDISGAKDGLSAEFGLKAHEPAATPSVSPDLPYPATPARTAEKITATITSFAVSEDKEITIGTQRMTAITSIADPGRVAGTDRAVIFQIDDITVRAFELMPGVVMVNQNSLSPDFLSGVATAREVVHLLNGFEITLVGVVDI